MCANTFSVAVARNGQEPRPPRVSFFLLTFSMSVLALAADAAVPLRPASCIALAPSSPEPSSATRRPTAFMLGCADAQVIWDDRCARSGTRTELVFGRVVAEGGAPTGAAASACILYITYV